MPGLAAWATPPNPASPASPRSSAPARHQVNTPWAPHPLPFSQRDDKDNHLHPELQRVRQEELVVSGADGLEHNRSRRHCPSQREGVLAASARGSLTAHSLQRGEGKFPASGEWRFSTSRGVSQHQSLQSTADPEIHGPTLCGVTRDTRVKQGRNCRNYQNKEPEQSSCSHNRKIIPLPFTSRTTQRPFSSGQSGGV